MAKSAQLISSPTSLLMLLHIVYELYDNESVYANPNDEYRLLWSSSILLSQIGIVRQSTSSEKQLILSEIDQVLPFLIKYTSRMTESRFNVTWKVLRDSGTLQVLAVNDAISIFMRELVADNSSLSADTLLERGRNQRLIGGFKRPSDLSKWSNESHLTDEFRVTTNFTNLRSTRGAVSIFSKDSILLLTICGTIGDNPEVTASMLVLPNNFTNNEDPMSTNVTEYWINSAVLTTTVMPENWTAIEHAYVEIALSLATRNEYRDVAFTRKTDRKHWLAKQVAETGSHDMEYQVICAFWDERIPDDASPSFQVRKWNTSICSVLGINLQTVSCKCPRTGTLVVGMESELSGKFEESFWKVSGAPDNRTYQLLKIGINCTGNAISLILLITLFIYIAQKKSVKDLKGYLRIKQNYLVALMIFHLTFLIFPLVEYIKLGCQSVGILMHLSLTSTLAWNGCQCFYLFGSLINGSLPVSLKIYVAYGWIVNILMVFITACVTSIEDYGMGIMCLPVKHSVTMNILGGAAISFLSLAILCSLILLCNIDTPAYLKPHVVEVLQ